MLRKITRAGLRPFAIGHLRNVQRGLCGICQKPISLLVKGNKSDYVVDHDHESGEIRGILHRSCNAAEGKVANAAGRWGAKSMAPELLIPWLENMLAYLKGPRTGVMYPGHKTAEEQEAINRQKRNLQAATRRAVQKVKSGAVPAE